MDITNPVINCPADVFRFVNSYTQSVQVSWSLPTASDNSGIMPTVTSLPSYPTQSFTSGVATQLIIYTATDQEGNYATCMFSTYVVCKCYVFFLHYVGLLLGQKKSLLYGHRSASKLVLF